MLEPAETAKSREAENRTQLKQKQESFAAMLVPLAILGLGVIVAVFLISTRPELAAKPVVERIWTVASVPATSVTVQPERRFYGRIVAGRDRLARAATAIRRVAVEPRTTRVLAAAPNARAARASCAEPAPVSRPRSCSRS